MGSWSHDCSSSAGLLDSYPALVLYLAGVALHQQPMGSRSHDCSSYVGCGGIPCSILVSPNASLHKWQQAVAPGWLPYMVPQNWIQARTMSTQAKGYCICCKVNRLVPQQLGLLKSGLTAVGRQDTVITNDRNHTSSISGSNVGCLF